MSSTADFFSALLSTLSVDGTRSAFRLVLELTCNSTGLPQCVHARDLVTEVTLNSTFFSQCGQTVLIIGMSGF
jgi:hypothetical protein